MAEVVSAGRGSQRVLAHRPISPFSIFLLVMGLRQSMGFSVDPSPWAFVMF